VRHAVELFRPTAPAHSLEFHAPSRPVQLECDAARIEQIVGNLIINAIKYSPDGGPIEVSVERRGSEAIVAVADHGMGITPENQKRVFDPFCRVISPDAVIPGVGLGLSTARMLIQAHGGRIELSSQVGAGTTFRVIFPDRLPAPPASPSRRLQSPQPVQ
jgi:signal transduction histidine kinase